MTPKIQLYLREYISALDPVSNNVYIFLKSNIIQVKQRWCMCSNGATEIIKDLIVLKLCVYTRVVKVLVRSVRGGKKRFVYRFLFGVDTCFVLLVFSEGASLVV